MAQAQIIVELGKELVILQQKLNTMKIPSTVAPVAAGLVLLAITVSTTTKNRALEGQVAEQKKFIDQREALIDSLHAFTISLFSLMTNFLALAKVFRDL